MTRAIHGAPTEALRRALDALCQTIGLLCVSQFEAHGLW